MDAAFSLQPPLILYGQSGCSICWKSSWPAKPVQPKKSASEQEMRITAGNSLQQAQSLERDRIAPSRGNCEKACRRQERLPQPSKNTLRAAEYVTRANPRCCLPRQRGKILWGKLSQPDSLARECDPSLNHRIRIPVAASGGRAELAIQNWRSDWERYSIGPTTAGRH